MPLVKHTLMSDVNIQLRRARDVDPHLVNVIKSVCESTPEIEKCYLLDAKKPDDADVWLAIALLAKNQQAFDHAAKRLSSVLNEFPEFEVNAFVMMASTKTIDRFQGFEFYTK